MSDEEAADLSATVLSSCLLCGHSPGHLTVGNDLLTFQKLDKMHFQTAKHRAKALADTWHSEYGCNLQLVSDEVKCSECNSMQMSVIACKW